MKIKKAVTITITVLVLAFLGFWAYVQVSTYPAEDYYLNQAKNNEKIHITENQNYFIIAPTSPNPSSMPIIFYPGGLVAPEAYLYKMGMVASSLDTNVFIIKAPFNAAIFNTGAARAIINSYNIEQAWVGGHSLGGIAACRFVSKNPHQVYGLYLFGSYSDQEILDFSGPVVSIMGLQDLIINRENYNKAKTNLPAKAIIMEVEDLNHSDFGNYGLQKGDGESNLSNEQVIEIIGSLFDN